MALEGAYETASDPQNDPNEAVKTDACAHFADASAWYRERGSNPHDLYRSTDFKSVASTNSAIPARGSEDSQRTPTRLHPVRDPRSKSGIAGPSTRQPYISPMQSFHTHTHTDILGRLAAQAALSSYVPYSGKKQGAVLLLEDGSVLQGCRVENASYQLTIGALDNVWSTAHAIGRMDVCAVASSETWSKADRAFLEAMSSFGWTFPTDSLAVLSEVLPEPLESIQPLLQGDVSEPATGAELARSSASMAWVPESDFPVGCIVRTESGHIVPGVNVEHPDWHRIICAERNALSTIVAYRYGAVTDIHVSCVKDPGGSPCGACRQVMVELAPNASVWLDRPDSPPKGMPVSSLLPGSFTGRNLRRHVT